MHMIIYYDGHVHYEMTFFTSFVVLADSENIDSEVVVTSDDGISCIDDTCGNVFVLVLSYNMTYDVLEMATV